MWARVSISGKRSLIHFLLTGKATELSLRWGSQFINKSRQRLLGHGPQIQHSSPPLCIIPGWITIPSGLPTSTHNRLQSIGQPERPSRVQSPSMSLTVHKAPRSSPRTSLHTENKKHRKSTYDRSTRYRIIYLSWPARTQMPSSLQLTQLRA